MLKAVIFDMDGVIINSHPVHKKAWKRFLSSVGREVSDEELDFVLEGRKREVILRHFLGDLTDEQIQAYGFRKELLFREEALGIEMTKGLPEFLDHLETYGISMAVGTSGSSSRVRYVLERLGMYSRFQAIVTGDEVPNGKPDPTIFVRAAERLHCPHSQVLVFEDAVSGVQAAKAAGMKCVGIAVDGRSQLLLDAGADQVLPNFVGARPEQFRLLFR